jgi:hypothetical protein
MRPGETVLRRGKVAENLRKYGIFLPPKAGKTILCGECIT